MGYFHCYYMFHTSELWKILIVLYITNMNIVNEHVNQIFWSLSLDTPTFSNAGMFLRLFLEKNKEIFKSK